MESVLLDMTHVSSNRLTKGGIITSVIIAEEASKETRKINALILFDCLSEYIVSFNKLLCFIYNTHLNFNLNLCQSVCALVL